MLKIVPVSSKFLCVFSISPESWFGALATPIEFKVEKKRVWDAAQ